MAVHTESLTSTPSRLATPTDLRVESPRVDEVVGVIGQNGLFRVATLYFESRTADLTPADGGGPQLKGILWGALQPPQLKD